MTTTDPFAALPAPLRLAMERRGFAELTPVQRAVLEPGAEARDLRVSSRTGSGKTVAIGLALAPRFVAAGERASAKAPAALLVAPTRELAVQVSEELRWLFADLASVRVQVVTGGTSLLPERRALARGCEILVGTPGRLLDHVRSGALRLDAVAEVVLDEADRMLELGFREELEAIMAELPAGRRSHMVSATFPKDVERLADRLQENALRVEGTAPGDAHGDIEHVVHVVRPGDEYGALVNVLLAAMGERCLVFVERRADAASLAERLASDGFAALPMSGELPQAQRTRTLDAFRNGSVPILIATDVAGRGIDVQDVAVVLHADLPKNRQDYTHRSGRTGRAGRKGRSVLLVPAQRRQAARRLLEAARVEASWVPAPSAAKVRKAFTKQARRRLFDLLSAERELTEQARTYAEGLLEGRDPVELVATLLELSEPAPPRQPAELVEVRQAPPPGPRPSGSRTPDRRPSGQPARKAGGKFARFSVNWGARRGATTRRVLAHVCKRGDIQGRHVGAIRVGPSSTTFEVDVQAADAFEAKASRRDAREPNLHISRYRDGDPRSRTASA